MPRIILIQLHRLKLCSFVIISNHVPLFRLDDHCVLFVILAFQICDLDRVIQGQVKISYLLHGRAIIIHMHVRLMVYHTPVDRTFFRKL